MEAGIIVLPTSMTKPLLRSIVFLMLTAGFSACSLNRNAHSDRAFGGGFGENDPMTQPVINEAQTEEPTSNDQSLPSEALVIAEAKSTDSKPSRFKTAVVTKLSKSLLEKEYKPYHDTTAKKTSKTRSGKPIEKNSMWSLILTIGGLFVIPVLPLIPALILGIIGLVKYRENPELYDSSSTTYAIVGISLSLLFLLLFAAYIFLMVFLIGFV